MSNQSHSGWHGDPWERCDRCGVDFPLSKLEIQVNVKGRLLVCSSNQCRDNTEVEQRDEFIRQVLEQPPQENESWANKKRTEGDDRPPSF